jgi:hypothetical protein
MKKLISIPIIAFSVLLFITSCLKEDNIGNPKITDFKIYMEDVDGNDSLVTEIYSGKKINIAVFTDADMVSLWPGGIRTIQSKKNSDIDSIDMFGNPVLIESDWFVDYGLVGAKGYKTSSREGGWHTTYQYPLAGQFNLTIVATNHGYAGFDIKQVIREVVITVR